MRNEIFFIRFKFGCRIVGIIFQCKSNVFLKLINRKSSPPKPFATVSSQISDKIIKQKIKDLRNDYLAKLKAKTTISINQNLWETLRKEYGAADDRKGN